MDLNEVIREKAHYATIGLGSTAIGLTVVYTIEKGFNPFAIGSGLIIGGGFLANSQLVKRVEAEDFEVDDFNAYEPPVAQTCMDQSISRAQWLRRNHA